MKEILRRLYWENVAAYIEDERLLIVHLSGIEERFEPFEVALRRWKECPIPDKPARRRVRRLRPAEPTSYLGTRIKIPRKRPTEGHTASG